ncbi:uncharacterized protein LOC6574937 [Drosophila mojavensis]|uniref:uncharacterized protein LOC6574937 n=1 Tax=Drosophila mojavensis TaxID=7230 RepID=UPI001CD07728|nr:uncharacterized protein LOC6574937 [Drosophila mojavensis]
MTTLHLSLLSLSILLAGELTSVEPQYHYHRYMLSDYRRQHRHGLQKDYSPVPRYSHFAADTTAAPGELTVNVNRNETAGSVGRLGPIKKVNVDQLMVRIFDGRKNVCMGTLIGSRVVATTMKCVKDIKSDHITIQTLKGKMITVNSTSVTMADNYTIAEINLNQPLIDDAIIPATCTKLLEPEDWAQVSLYGPHGVINELVTVKPHKYCRAMVNETTFSYADAFLVCIGNTNESNFTGCSGNYGSPLIFKDQICGINLMGRRCLPSRKFDLYALVLNKKAFERRMVARIIESQVEDKSGNRHRLWYRCHCSLLEMLSKIIRLALVLLLVCQQSELRADKLSPDKAGNSLIKMAYKWNDWRPHFGYNPAHWAINHRHSRRSRSKQKDLLSHLVYLRFNYNIICSGIVVNNRTVLTVTSCLDRKEPPKIIVHFTDGTAQTASSSSPSSDYTMSSGSNLLSFLHLEKPLDQEFDTPPPFCTQAVRPQDNVMQLNWDKNYSRPIPRFVPQMPLDQCQTLNRDARMLAPAVHCVENTQYTDECIRSYGLPYVWKGAFCGMNINGHNCSVPSNADVYVRLLREKRLISKMLRTAAASIVDEEIV